MFYDGYCKTCDMPVEEGLLEADDRAQAEMIGCDPDACPNCQYIGEGDSYCDEIGEIVLEDWTPTDHYMGAGCPYRKAQLLYEL